MRPLGGCSNQRYGLGSVSRAPVRRLSKNDSQQTCAGDAVCSTYRNAEWTKATVTFRNIHAFERQWFVAMPSQGMYGLPLLCWSIPHLLVYPWCVLAAIFRHSSDCQGFRTQRVGQEML